MILVQISEGESFIAVECDASEEAAEVLEQIAGVLRLAGKVKHAGSLLVFKTAPKRLMEENLVAVDARPSTS